MTCNQILRFLFSAVGWISKFSLWLSVHATLFSIFPTQRRSLKVNVKFHHHFNQPKNCVQQTPQNRYPIKSTSYNISASTNQIPILLNSQCEYVINVHLFSISEPLLLKERLDYVCCVGGGSQIALIHLWMTNEPGRDTHPPPHCIAEQTRLRAADSDERAANADVSPANERKHLNLPRQENLFHLQETQSATAVLWQLRRRFRWAWPTFTNNNVMCIR